MPKSAAIRILALALAVGALAAIVLPGNAIGVNVPLLAVALVAAAVAAAGEAGLRRVDRADLWLAPVGIALAAATALRTDPWLVALDLLAAATLLSAAIATLGGARVTRGAASAVIASAVGAMLAPVLGMLVVAAAAIRREPADPAADPAADSGAQRGLRRRLAIPLAARPVLRGLAIALPLVLLFTALFSAADAVFGRIASSLLDWRLHFDMTTLTVQAMVTGVVAWGTAGLLALGAAGLSALDAAQPATAPAGWGNGSGTAMPRSAATAPPGLGTVEATTVLVVLDALFVVFVGLQVAYLFGGRDTLAASGFTYAEYARRGFFELVLAAAIAGSIAVGLDQLVRGRSRAQLGASVALLALTLVILASALARLRLYQDVYGWTELRFVVLVSIAWLAVAVVGTVVLLVRCQTRWALHGLAVLTIAAVGVMNVIGPEAYVATQNLARAANPALVPAGGKTGLDTDYLEVLGDEAIPAAILALPSLAPADRTSVERLLDGRAMTLEEELAGTGWPSWNLSREQVRAALREWRATQ